MSDGNLWVYGDEITYTGSPINFATTDAQWRTINGDVHQWFIDSYDLESLDNNGDDEVDMIIFVNRARHSLGYQGIAANYLPTGTISGDSTEPVIRGSSSVVTNSGVYQRDVYALSSRYIIFHEIGHQLRQSGHLNGLHRWNLMSGAGTTPPTGSGLVLSAWEKQELGWLTFTEITDDRLSYELLDVTASQQAITIPAGGNNYFLLEYRKNNTYFEITLESECLDTQGLAQGLLVSYSSGGAPTIRPADSEVAWADPPTNSKKDGDATDLFPNGGITEITPFTTPDTDDHLGNPTGIAITNIHYEGDNIVFNIYQNYYTGAWSGNVTTNTAWGGNVTINSDVTVQSGATLYIDAGTTISIASGSTDLWVEGQIIAKGTASNPITFTASAANPQPSEWGTIFVESDDNVFEHCTVEYSDLGIKIYDTTYLTGNVVKNCTLENNDQGLRFQNADVTVENNTIRDNRHGVVAINADGLFTGNSIYNNDRDGIYAINGTLDFFSNNIYSNGLGQTSTIHGINASSGSDVNVGGEFGTYGNPGYNEIYDNEGSGVHMDNSSATFMGHKVGYGGYNSVYDNGVYSGYDVNNLNTSATVEAHKNWWGTSSPSSSQFNGDVDYTFYLTSQPVAPKASGNPTRTLITSSISDKTLLVDSLKTAADTDSKIANRKAALVHYYSIVRRDKNDALDEKTNAIGFLNGRLAAESDAAIKSQAFLFLLDAYLDQSQNQALLSAIATLPSYLSAGGAQAAYSYGIFANVALGDFTAADKLLQTYQQQYPKASEIVFLQEYIDGAQGIFAEQGSTDELAKSTTNGAQPTSMLAAYPNPFNPSTHIRYTLPHTGEVSIRIFNLLGEEERGWQIATNSAGAHTLLWDGKDGRGVEVSSGVYLLQISYRSFENGALQVVQSRKLTLVR